MHAVSPKISILAALCMWRVRDSVLLCAFTGLGYLFTPSKVSTVIRFIVQLTLRLLLSYENYWSVVQNKEDLELIQRVPEVLEYPIVNDPWFWRKHRFFPTRKFRGIKHAGSYFQRDF